LVAVHLSLMRQHFDPYFDAARVPLSNPGLQRQEHLLEALAVELAQLGGLGVGQANDGAPERPVNRLHGNLIPLGKLGVPRHRASPSGALGPLPRWDRQSPDSPSPAASGAKSRPRPSAR